MGVGVGCLSRLAAGENPVRLPLMVGAGRADITAPLEVGILMSSGRELWEPFQAVRLPLYARAVVIQRGDRKVAIVALDLIGLAGEAVGGMKRFRERVVAAADGAVAADDVVLASSHTHSSPESIALTDLKESEPFQRWAGRLAEQIGAAIQTAAGDLRACRLAVSEQTAPGMNVNRRVRTERGIRSAWGELSTERVIGPEGPNDETIRVAAFLDKSDQPIAILVNATAHPVLEMCLPEMSPDYPGEMAIALEKRYPSAMALFLQGACGNINPPKMERCPENARAYGQKLAGFVEAAMGGLEPMNDGGLDLAWKWIQLPLRSVKDTPAATPLTARVGALRIGGAAFVFLPGEPFLEIAVGIREKSPLKFTAVVGYSDDYIGYIPTDRAFDHGGYEVSTGLWSRLDRGSAAIVCNAAVELTRLALPE